MTIDPLILEIKADLQKLLEQTHENGNDIRKLAEKLDIALRRATVGPRPPEKQPGSPTVPGLADPKTSNRHSLANEMKP